MRNIHFNALTGLSTSASAVALLVYLIPAALLLATAPSSVYRVMATLSGVVTGGPVTTGLGHHIFVRTFVRQGRAGRDRTSTCVSLSGPRAEGVPEAPALTPTTHVRLCPNTRQHWVDVTQEHHMPEHTRTGRASLRLVDPDERVPVDPFAVPVFRSQRPGPVVRLVAGTEREPNPVREKPS